MSGYSVFEAGPAADWAKPTFAVPAIGFARPGTQFLQETLGLSGAEVSLNVFRPGEGMPFHHRHRKNEELYLFLSGTGEMTLDGTVVPIRPGTCVRVAPPVARAWRNTGTADLQYIVIQYLAGSPVGPTVSDGEPA